jgi:hypothetical protein
VGRRGHTFVLVFVQMVQTTSVETGGAPNDAIHLVAFREQ